MKKIILFSILASTLLLSCESKTYDDVSVTTTDPSYETDIKPIFVSNCTTCHSNDNQSRNFDSYDLVKTGCTDELTAGNGTILTRIDDKDATKVMPQSGKMPKSKIQLIKLWAQKGYKQ